MKAVKFMAAGCLALALVSCKKDKGPETETTTPPPSGPSYTIPTTYSFSSMNYTTSVQRIAMLAEMTTYIRTTHTVGAAPVLNGTKLTDMYANANSQFTDANLNGITVQLKDKTDNTINLQTDIDTKLNEVATLSQTTPMASSGTAGKSISNDNTKAYMVDANGLEYKEYLEKGIMAAVFMSQATTLLNNIGTYDNNTVVTGQGTAMEHAWDEAFGYFGVPAAFPTTTVGVKNWGSYCNSVSLSMTGSSTHANSFNVIIMNAWLKGRSAISNKDYTARDEAKAVILGTWEKVAAARCITYLKGAKTNIADNGPRNHNLSEAVGFVNGFRYNAAPNKVISNADISQLMGYIGTNFYNITTTNIDNAINFLASEFSLDPNTL